MAKGFPNLQKNVLYNVSVTSWIERLYGSALFALVILLLSRIVPAVKQGGMSPANELTIALVLGLLSLQSLDFYNKLIIKLREDPFGQRLSIWLVVVLLLLIVVGIFFGLLSVIGVGIGFITWKSWRLYRDSKTHNYGVVSKSYFKRIRTTYLSLLVLTLPLGLLADFGGVILFPKNQPLSAYVAAKEKIDRIDTLASDSTHSHDSIRENVDSLKTDVSELYSNWESVKTQNSMILSGGIVVLLFVIVYGAYKGALIRKPDVLDMVLRELEVFYKRYYQEHPQDDPTREEKDDNDPTPNGGGLIAACIALFSTVRIFISSIAGMIAMTVYLSTTSYFSLKTAFVTFGVVALTSGYGFSLNDYIDRDKDRINHSARALPSGRLSLRQVLVLVFILLSASIFFSLYLTNSALIIDLVTILLLTIYSFVNNRFGIWANAITATCSSFTIVFGMSVGGFSMALTLCAIGVFFMIFGREVVLDVRDLIADKAFGKTSVPIRYGLKGAINISMYLFIVSSLFLVVSAIVWGTTSFMLFVGLFSNVLLWAGFIYFRLNSSPSNIERFLVLTRIAFLCLIPALLL